MKNLKLFLKAGIMVFLAILLVLSGCYYIFHFVNQPLTADPNSSFEVEVAMGWDENYERGEPTDHCFVVKLPEGWIVNDSILVSDSISQGYFLYSQSLTDSISNYYPASENYQWHVFQLSFDLEAALAIYNSKADYEDSLFFKPIINTDNKNGNFWLDYHLGSSYDIISGYFNSSSTNHLITIGFPDTILVTNTNDNGLGSLRAAIDSANGETIQFDLEKGSIIVLKTQLDVNKGIIIEGPGSKELSVSGDSSCRVFHVHPNQSMFISGLTIENGYVDGELGGSAILVDSLANLTATELSITQNKDLAFYGGSICCNYKSRVELDNINFLYNSSLIGGCVSSLNADLNIQNSTLSYNSGSALYFQNDGNTNNQITGTTITNNSGAGIYVEGMPPIFDTENRCNIYLNNKDLVANNSYPPVEVFVDTFTVRYPHKYHISPVDKFSMDILNAKIEQVDADLYVSPDGDNENSGFNASEPLKNIRYALNKMIVNSEDPHSIHLNEGIYSSSGNGEFFPLTMLDYTSIKGSGPETTVLDAEGDGPIFYFSEEIESNIEGLTILGSSNRGIYCNSSNPIIKNIACIKNSSSGSGGGMYFINSDPYLVNVDIAENSTHSRTYAYGGGLYFEMSNPVLLNVRIADNYTERNGAKGGGIFITRGKAIMSNVSITGNSAISASGAGIYSEYSDIILNNTLIADNKSSYGHGGGLYFIRTTSTILNSSIVNNRANINTGRGGGLAGFYTSSVNVINSIIWNNVPEEVYITSNSNQDSINIYISYSDIKGGQGGIHSGLNATIHWLEGNINQDPVFVNVGDHPYQINDNSPCIDASDTAGLNLPEYDLAGEMRLVNERVDMGAYEWNLMVGNDEQTFGEQESNEILVYPNPIRSFATLRCEFDPSETIKVNIYNSAGICLKKWEYAGQEEFILSLVDLPRGIYYLSIKTGNEITTKKIVKL